MDYQYIILQFSLSMPMEYQYIIHCSSVLQYNGLPIYHIVVQSCNTNGIPIIIHCSLVLLYRWNTNVSYIVVQSCNINGIPIYHTL